MSTATVALSLTQPWATLAITGAKSIETRSWKTPHRGALGIHAAKAFPRWAIELCFEEPVRTALTNAGISTPGDLPRGVLLGHVTLLDCAPTDSLELADLTSTERAFGDYAPGRYGWLFEQPVPSDPQPMRGALGLWPIPTPTAAAMGGAR